MKFPFLKHPKTGAPDLMTTAIVIAVLVASFKFLLDGLSINIAGHTITFGHLEALAYGSFLTPILGAHSYIDTRKTDKPKVDNPDK